MKVLLIGASGHVGAAIRERLGTAHEVIAVSRSTDPAVDVGDPESVRRLFEAVGPVDAVITAVGKVPFKRPDEMSHEDLVAGFTGKVLGQLDVVRQGLDHVTDGGSFTLTTGIIGRELIRSGAIASMANGAIERFVPAAAVEMPRGLRINVVSPSVLLESPHYHPAFPGFIPVPAARVAEAYAKSVEGIATGQVFCVD